MNLNYRIPYEVTEYFDFIRSHPEEHNEWYFLFIELVEYIFEHEELYYDRYQIDKYFSYQKYFPFNLFPWEKCLFILHNCVFKSDGRPRWPNLFIFVGRGAGKNGYLSFEDFCLLTETHGIWQYHIDIYATSEDQARTSFDEIYDVLEANRSVMKYHFKWNKEEIQNLKTKSKLKFRTRNPETKDGGRPGKNDFDEEHAYVNNELIEVANGGLGKKPHPRKTIISTQGDVRGGPLDHDLKRGKAVLERKISDNGFLPFLCMLNDESEIHNKVNWNIPNPSLRYRPDLQDIIENEYIEYLEEPTSHKAFVVKRMNVIKEETEAAVTSWENIQKANEKLVPDLRGFPCIGSIDYAKTSDMVVAGLLFKKEGIVYFIYHVWLCRNSKDFKRIKIDKEMFISQGEMTIVEDNEISPEIVVDWFREKKEMYNIIFFTMDNFRQTLFKKFLKLIGFDMNEKKNTKLIRPSDIMKVVPVIEHYFSQGLIGWGLGYEHSMMNWFTNNTKTVDAGKGNYVYDKIEPKSRKTDGFSAFAGAMTCVDMLPDYNDFDFDIEVFEFL